MNNPLSIKKDKAKNVIVKAQIEKKISENEQYYQEEFENLDDKTQLDLLQSAIKNIDNNILQLNDQKRLIFEKIKTLNDKLSINDDLQLIVDIIGTGTFSGIEYTEIRFDNKTRYVFLRKNIKNIQSSPDFKQHKFHLKISSGNSSAWCTIKYSADKIDHFTNSVMCEHSFSL
jgi:hypothetical protein